MSWNNEDGLFQRFDTETSVVAGDGQSNSKVQVLHVVIDSADLPAITDIYGDRPYIPANAVILDSVFVCETAWTGTTPTLTVGLAEQDQTVIDADGIDAAVAVDTEQAAAGDVFVGDGALTDRSVTVGTANAYVYAATGGTVTAGKSHLYIRFMKTDL